MVELAGLVAWLAMSKGAREVARPPCFAAREACSYIVLPAERAKVERKASVPFFFFFFLSRHKGNTLVMRVLASHCIYHSPYNWLPLGRVLKGVVPLSFVSCPRLWPLLSI